MKKGREEYKNCGVELRGEMHSSEMDRVEWLRDKDGKLAGALRYPVYKGNILSCVLCLLIACLISLMVLLAFNIDTGSDNRERIVLRSKNSAAVVENQKTEQTVSKSTDKENDISSRLDFFAGTLVLLSEADGNPSIPAAAKAILSSPEGIRIYLNYAEAAYQDSKVSAEATARAMAQTIALLDNAVRKEESIHSDSGNFTPSSGEGETGGVTDGDIVPSFKTSE